MNGANGGERRPAAVVLVDAQTAPSFAGSDGVDKVLESVAGRARIVLRRAYGRWFGPEMRDAQDRLAALGFELVHTYAPIPASRASTVQLALDALELADRTDGLAWVVLVSGDGNLAPLARRLQQRGLQVFVAGARGVADRTIRPCCDELVLFDAEAPGRSPRTRHGAAPRPLPSPRRPATANPAAAEPSTAATTTTTFPAPARPFSPAVPPEPARAEGSRAGPEEPPTPAPTSTLPRPRVDAGSAIEEARRATREILADAGGVVDCLRLRMAIVARIPGFDERALGCDDFLAFVRGDRFLALEADDGSWVVRLAGGEAAGSPTHGAATAAGPTGSPAPVESRRRPVKVGSPFYRAAASAEVYAGLLRKLGWDFVDAGAVRAVFAALSGDGLPAARAEMVACVSARLAGAVDERRVRRALSALVKSGCLVRDGNGDGPGRWSLADGLTADRAIERVDEAMLSRLRSCCESYQVPWNPAVADSLRLGRDAGADHVAPAPPPG